MITVKDHGKSHKKLIISSAESQVEILVDACNMEIFYLCTLQFVLLYKLIFIYKMNTLWAEFLPVGKR